MNTNSYLLFSIGPVQEFIAASRKTLDLFSGSMLLSHLISEAIGVVLDNSGEMIFPLISDRSQLSFQSSAALPNRFYCKIPTLNAVTTGENAVEAVQFEFSRIANSNHVKGSFGIEKDNIWNSFWKAQIPNFLEIYWALLENDETIPYSKQYQLIESALGKRKLLREFNQLEQPGIKCSIILNFSAAHSANVETKDFWKKQAEKQKKYFKPGENLSTIAITKRKFLNAVDQDDSFPSISTFATSGFKRNLIKQAITDTDLKKTIGEYAAKVQILQESLFDQREIKNLPSLYELANNDKVLLNLLGVEGDWFYSESYDNKRVKREYVINEEDTQKLVSAHEAHINLVNAIKSHNDNQSEISNIIGSPSKYYAVLYFDGDKMGSQLTSENIQEDDHKQISNALKKFSSETIFEILEQNNRLGKVIYAGGDDVIAFCAIDDLYDIILEIRTKFSEALLGKVNGIPTGSIGVVIAHHQTNLQSILETMRKAENYAKDVLNRDSLAIALLKRSGEHSLCGAKWFPNGKNTIEFLKEFSQRINNKTISTSFVYDLEKERIALEGNLHEENLVLSEIKRLLLRRTAPNKKEEVIEFYENQFKPYYNALKFQDNDITLMLKQFIDLLEIAQFIARGGVR